MSTAETRRNKSEGRKRFTDKQISFLEYMFETQSRPELRMKHQLANELGLHPRQVAIWFQNKRARSKSRQIEREYNTLKHDYETLTSKSESLKQENQALLNQLEMLRNVAERHQENTRRLDSTGNSSCEESDDRITYSAIKKDAENYSQEISVPVYDSVAYFGEESKFVDIEEQLCSVNDWEETTCGFEPDVPKWWEFCVISFSPKCHPWFDFLGIVEIKEKGRADQEKIEDGEGSFVGLSLASPKKRETAFVDR